MKVSISSVFVWVPHDARDWFKEAFGFAYSAWMISYALVHKYLFPSGCLQHKKCYKLYFSTVYEVRFVQIILLVLMPFTMQILQTARSYLSHVTYETILGGSSQDW